MTKEKCCQFRDLVRQVHRAIGFIFYFDKTVSFVFTCVVILILYML